MSRDYDNPPSCGYFVARPCARPMKCPVHRPLLMRPSRNRHKLDADSRLLVKQVAPLDFMVYLKTLCGVKLHQNIDLDAEIEAVTDVIDYGLNRFFKVTNSPGYYKPPPPSEDSSYEVFTRVGTSYEVLISDVPTCKRCIKV